MLLSLPGRRLYYDLIGREDGPVVCITHSLASDSGMWAEQMPPLLQAGFRVLRVDMRGHGGSGPVAGDYTMKMLAGDVAMVLDALSLARVHYVGLSIGGMIGQVFAIEHDQRGNVLGEGDIRRRLSRPGGGSCRGRPAGDGQKRDQRAKGKRSHCPFLPWG